MKAEFRETITSIVDYERYLADKYDFRPFDFNEDHVWDDVIKRECHGKNKTWYQKFIKKYYKKKLLPKNYLKLALEMEEKNTEIVDNLIESNDERKIMRYFLKDKRIRKPKIFYKAN